MDLTIKAAFIGAFAALIAAFVTVFVGDRLNARREARKAARIKTLISLEIDSNLKDLSEFWNEMAKIEPSKVKADFKILPEVTHLVNIPLLRWSTIIWQNQMSLLPLVLTAEEARIIHRIYTKLAEITNIHSTIWVTHSEFQQPDFSDAPMETNYHKLGFYHNSARLFEQIKAITLDLEATGNPLAKDR